MKKAGKNYTACCPFHKEKTPSFSVSPDKQFYYCFGCGAGGNALGFIMDHDNLDFPQAVEELAKAAGMEIPPRRKWPPAQTAATHRFAAVPAAYRCCRLLPPGTEKPPAAQSRRRLPQGPRPDR